MGTEFTLLVDGVDFGEGPRWHDGRLWYSDFYQRAIYTVSEDGTRETMYGDLPDQPSGLGWMPDGSLLVVFMTTKKLMRSDGSGGLVEHADLSSVASFYCNDMVVDTSGNAYVGNFGFDLHGGEAHGPADLALVRPDGTVSVAASGLMFPNGSVITPDGGTLIVGESLGAGYKAFTIGAYGTLSDERVWAAIPGATPDGCCLDADGGIWFSDAFSGEILRVKEGGEVTHRIATPTMTYACMLGGSDGRTLFVLCAPDSHPDVVAGAASGAIYTMRVEHPAAGLP